MKGALVSKLGLGLMVLLVALLLAPAGSALAAQKVVRITLIDENGSGEDGATQFTDNGNGTTKVEVIMLNMPAGVEQPASIHKGTCASLDPDVEYALNNVEPGGRSTTTIKVALSELLSEKYAVVVMKSTAAADSKVVYSCGILPSAAAASGTMTVAQSMEQLVDQAEELEGIIEKKEADAAQNAYDAYHQTFASVEGQIMKKDAATQAKLEAAMNDVGTELAKKDWAGAAEAVEELVDLTKEAQTLMGADTTTTTTTPAGNPASGEMDETMQALSSAAADLVRETKFKDKTGSDKAYEEFHALFAANEDAIREKSPEAQAHIEDAMHEVRDAIAAGDWTAANTAANELAKAIADATVNVILPPTVPSTGGTSLPQTGASELPLLLSLLAGAALLAVSGLFVRRRSLR